jgi:hypothetical protein
LKQPRNMWMRRSKRKGRGASLLSDSSIRSTNRAIAIPFLDDSKTGTTALPSQHRVSLLLGGDLKVKRQRIQAFMPRNTSDRL